MQPLPTEPGLGQGPLHQPRDRGRRAVQHDAVHAVRAAVTVQDGEGAVREARIGGGFVGLPCDRAGRGRWLAERERVTDAIAHWHSRTRIRFVERTAANAAQFPDFVRFVPGNGCSSHVGRRGGQQSITLGPNCSTGNAIHEIGHTVGLWHEQSREDRDQHVTIVFANIEPDMQHNFLQQIADGDDLGPYDFGSIMHYPATAFAIDPNQPTIIPRESLPPGVTMGQRTGLSQGDIDGVHMMYPAAQSTFKEVAKDPVVDTTFKEAAKDPVGDGPHKIPGLDIMSPPALSSPFVLATPHQSPMMAGQPDGVAEQVRQLGQMVASLQQGLSAVQASYNLLLAQAGAQPLAGAGQLR
ncbi:hypothetical protein EAO75_09200 [Streptomyces sp. uw30]|nr:hypothetical protein EAO75_09200 [Streptomyces sp. uw30]